MQHDHALILFDHLYWIRDKVLDAADHPGVPFTAEAHVTIRDLRATLVHELDVEWSWRERLAGPTPTSFAGLEEDLDPLEVADVAALRRRWADDERSMRAWLATLDDATLAGPCAAETPSAHPAWFHLQHLYTHALQQFSDAAVTLTLVGRSPGGLDFLEFAQQHRATAAGRVVDGS
jgi:uncharacterized damage-inducible protein DinB